jgi:hypothetical protein
VLIFHQYGRVMCYYARPLFRNGHSHFFKGWEIEIFLPMEYSIQSSVRTGNHTRQSVQIASLARWTGDLTRQSVQIASLARWTGDLTRQSVQIASSARWTGNPTRQSVQMGVLSAGAQYLMRCVTRVMYQCTARC